jgi:hypothetical protein
LIARELLMRKKVREIVVACPPSMLLQWQEELEQRFGLLFEILDKDFIAQIRRERGFGVNPWTAHSRFLISHRLLIDEAYAGPLRNWLGTFRPGTMLILDEAHHAAPSSGQRYAIDSQITRAIQGLSPRFEHRLFLSATPHNGHSNSFTALLGSARCYRRDPRSHPQDEPRKSALGRRHIHGELLKLGIQISETSLAKYMVRERKPPSQTWLTFLNNRVKNLVSVDFFTVPTIRFRCCTCFWCWRMTGVGWCTSMSPRIPPRNGRLTNCARPFRLIKFPAICSAIAIRFSAILSESR